MLRVTLDKAISRAKFNQFVRDFMKGSIEFYKPVALMGELDWLSVRTKGDNPTFEKIIATLKDYVIYPEAVPTLAGQFVQEGHDYSRTTNYIEVKGESAYKQASAPEDTSDLQVYKANTKREDFIEVTPVLEFKRLPLVDEDELQEQDLYLANQLKMDNMPSAMDMQVSAKKLGKWAYPKNQPIKQELSDLCYTSLTNYALDEGFYKPTPLVDTTVHLRGLRGQMRRHRWSYTIVLWKSSGVHTAKEFRTFFTSSNIYAFPEVRWTLSEYIYPVLLEEGSTEVSEIQFGVVNPNLKISEEVLSNIVRRYFSERYSGT